MIRSNAILSGRKVPLSVVRSTVAIVDHEQVTTPQAPFTIRANSRPLNNQETRFLQEGQRADSFRVINCSEQLFTADDKLGVVGDIIEAHLGFDWRVVGAKEWGAGTRHNAYTIQKFQVTP